MLRKSSRDVLLHISQHFLPADKIVTTRSTTHNRIDLIADAPHAVVISSKTANTAKIQDDSVYSRVDIRMPRGREPGSPAATSCSKRARSTGFLHLEDSTSYFSSLHEVELGVLDPAMETIIVHAVRHEHDFLDRTVGLVLRPSATSRRLT